MTSCIFLEGLIWTSCIRALRMQGLGFRVKGLGFGPR